MLKSVRLALIAMCLTALAVAGKFDSTWTSPDVEPLNFAGKKVVALVLGQNRTARRISEAKLAQAIAGQGAIAIAANALIPESDMSDREKVKSLLHDNDVVGVVVIRSSVKGQQPMDPEALKSPQYKSFWGFYGDSWESESASSTPPKDAKIRVETIIYSLVQDKLVWIGTSETKASNADQFIRDLGNDIVKEMQKHGLVKKPS